MSSNINLLIQQDDRQEKRQSTNMMVLRFVTLGLVFLVPFITIVLFLLILFSPLNSLLQEKKELLSTASSLQTKATQVAVINDRLTKATHFIAAQDIYDQIFQELQDLASSDISLAQISIAADNVTYSATSPSLLSLKNYRAALMQEKSLEKVTFSQISADIDGKYVTNFTLQIHG